jgi:PAS domain S-box-containing protein
MAEVRSGASSQSPPCDLDSAIHGVRSAVEKQLRILGQSDRAVPPTDLEALHLAMEELSAAWENLNTQSDELLRQRDHYAQLFQHAPDAYIVTDGAGAIRELNLAAEKLLQFRTQYLTGKPLALFLAMDDRPSFRTNLNAMLAEGRQAAKSWAAGLQYGPGPKTKIELTAAPIRASAGEFQGICWVLRRAA